jgi:(p)ppGpp synthase/HD superfamily hydrolase
VSEANGPGSAIPEIYALQEAAKLLGVTPKWLRDQLTRRRFAGLKRAGKWAMTESQILSAIEMMSTEVRPQEAPAPGGLTRRSWLYHQRYPNGRHRRQSGKAPVHAPSVQPLPSWYRRVHPEPPEGIAALLHDAAEDQGGKETLVEIRERFGSDVERIVAECSDTFEKPKPPWRERKTSYIEHLKDASNDTILVSLADKVDNARAILRDFRGSGSELWQRFSVKDPNDHLWYYRSLLDVYKHKTDSWLVDELRRTLDMLEELVKA